ncbi:glutathione peroxidase [Paenibacillus rhizovicinus]|uniref:Glutathione peroxidase n=1 Tax=Paenibacillus rhizovicinus TaxID=2704463 RepID=A0A6C0P2T0_9BACL|nr:glutathione peroxidase [Paenibacillus rhizovicinus]QHW32787.1 glutathione peroxidase [Paenibacillus rhizovicinus]
MSIYTYAVKGNDHEQIAMSEYRDKVLLIVNTASRCGYSRHFAGIQKLYETYRGQGFEVLGFPCNQFNAKEPDGDASVLAYCRGEFGVTFPLAAKTDVIGPDAHPLFSYLTAQLPFAGFDASTENGRWMRDFLTEKYPDIYAGNGVKWNFTKFLIDRDGRPAERFETPVEPESLAPAIEALLRR